MSADKINIVLSGDHNVLPGLEAVIYSTMMHNRIITWHIMTMDLDVVDYDRNTGCHFVGLNQQEVEWLRFMVQFMNKDSELHVYDLHDLYTEHLANSVNRFTSFTPYASLRLLIDQVLDTPHALYLDADVIVQDSIEPMYWEYLRRDITYAAYSLPNANNGYGELISAVLLFDLNACRNTGLFSRARYNYNHIKHLFPDQNAIALAGTAYPLPETYNYMYDHKAATYKPTILHFTNDNHSKIYQDTPGEWYRYYPEHRYIKDGIDIIRETYTK